jgi:urea transport system permease protein
MTMTTFKLPQTAPLLTRKAWSVFLLALIVVGVLAPVFNLLVPAGSAFHLSDYAIALIGKIMCYAICALAMDLIWGYTGILSLGHGLFFALGGYVMGMYLMRQIGQDGNYKSNLPDFMVFLDWKELPWHWLLSGSFIATLCLVVLAPGLIAFVFGYFAFRSRIKGVYFSIITQAMTYAAMLLFFRLHRLQANFGPADCHARHAHGLVCHHRCDAAGLLLVLALVGGQQIRPCADGHP